MYQQLEGGRGREVYFRAPRIQAGLLVRGEVPLVRLGEFHGRVRDLSSDGLLCDLPRHDELPKCGAVVPIQIRLRDETLFSATAEVVRAESVRGASRIAVRFLGALLSPDQLRSRAQDAIFRGAFDAGLSIYETVPAEYRVAINDAALILLHWWKQY